MFEATKARDQGLSPRDIAILEAAFMFVATRVGRALTDAEITQLNTLIHCAGIPASAKNLPPPAQIQAIADEVFADFNRVG